MTGVNVIFFQYENVSNMQNLVSKQVVSSVLFIFLIYNLFSSIGALLITSCFYCSNYFINIFKNVQSDESINANELDIKNKDDQDFT